MAVLTEDAAKKCWCPHARREGGDSIITEVVATDDGLGSSSPREVGRVSCVASKCMAWTWVPLTNGDDERLGFCGLVRINPVQFLVIHPSNDEQAPAGVSVN